jgi:hypothetical protein
MFIHIFDSNGQIEARRHNHDPLQNIKTWLYNKIQQINYQQHEFDKCRIMQGKDKVRDERFLSFQVQQLDGKRQKRRCQQEDEREVLRPYIQQFTT